MNKKLEKLINNISVKMNEMNADLLKAMDGNKAAAQRARKKSLELGKMFLEFRKLSVQM